MLLDREYVALALLKAKYELFNEDFATLSELNQFIQFMQKKFTDQMLGISISSNRLDIDVFDTTRGVVTLTGRGYYNLEGLHDNVLKILTDKKLIIECFIKIAKERLKDLKRYELKNS